MSITKQLNEWMNEWMNDSHWIDFQEIHARTITFCTQFPHHIAWQPGRWSSLWYYFTVERKDERAGPQHKTLFSCNERLTIIKLVAATYCFIKRVSLQLLNFLAKLYCRPSAITLTSCRPFLHVLYHCLVTHFLTSTDFSDSLRAPRIHCLDCQ